MKILSGETHKKINQRIESLERQVGDLTRQCSALEQREAASSAELRVAEQRLSQAAKTEASLQATIEALKAELALSNQAAGEIGKELADARTSLADSLARASKLENELQRTEAELKAQAEAGQRAEQDLTGQRAAVEKLQSDLKRTSEQLAQSRQALSTAQDIAAKESQAVADERERVNAEGETQRKQLAKELETLRAEAVAQLESLKGELEKARAEAKVQREQLQKDLEKHASDFQGLNKKYQQLTAKQHDTAQENELLLMQLAQAQEELVEYYDESNRLKKLYETLKARWERLEKRYPNYVDYAALELLSFDASSVIPSLTWRLKEYTHAGVSSPEFVFRIALQDGCLGIGVVRDGSERATKDDALVPGLLDKSLQQVQLFRLMGSTENRQLTAALAILAQMDARGWSGVDLPIGLDIKYWSPFLKGLVSQWAAMPPTLRYDTVKLKRELINPDYEHLWLELHGASFGKHQWDKLEIRLGAALIEANGFSKFPKFEIPLIDGRAKPFGSWYAESQDDSGEKLELRFSLEKRVFDTAVLNNLAEGDRSLVLHLVHAMPRILQQMKTQKVPIHRPWDTWIGFAQDAVGVVDAGRTGAGRANTEAIKRGRISRAAIGKPKRVGQLQSKSPNVQEKSEITNVTTKVINIPKVSQEASVKKTVTPKAADPIA